MVSKLVHTLFTQHPEFAIAQSTGFARDKVAALLRSLPDDVFNAAINCIPVPVYLDIFSHLTLSRKIKVLSTLPFQQAHILLLGLPDTQQIALLEALNPTFKRLHHYYEKIKYSDVGKMMKSTCFTTVDNVTVKQVKEKLGKLPPFLDVVFVLDSQHRYLGRVRVSQLAHHSHHALIGECIDSAKHTIHIHQKLAGVVENPGWQTQQFLPVLDDERHFLGVIEINAVYQFIMASADQLFQSPVTTVITVFLSVINEILEMLLGTQKSRGHHHGAPRT